MSTKENKEVVHRYIDGLNRKNTGVMDQLFSPQFNIHTTVGDFNREQYKAAVDGLLAAFPDLKYTLDDMVGEGDKIAARYSSIGTHRGTYSGLMATGRQVKNTGIGIYKFAEGKVVEVWMVTDNLGLMQQLGALPSAKGKNVREQPREFSVPV